MDESPKPTEQPKPPECKPKEVTPSTYMTKSSEEWTDKRESHSNRNIATWMIGFAVNGLFMGIEVGSHWIV